MQFGWFGRQVHGLVGIGQTQFIGRFCSDVGALVVCITRDGFTPWFEHEHEHGCWIGQLQFGWFCGQVHGRVGIGQTQFIAGLFLAVETLVIGNTRVGFNIWAENERGQLHAGAGIGCCFGIP